MRTLNEKEIRRAWKLYNPDDEVVEVRMIKKSPKTVLSGYFRDVDTLIKRLTLQNLSGFNIYFTIHALNNELYSREQRDVFVKSPPTTSDRDVIRYKYLFIDLDPKRPSEISSTNAELQSACDTCEKIRDLLSSEGFERPIIEMSGNGYHLLYRVDFPNTNENKDIVSSFLKRLDSMFTDDAVEVDKTTFNPSRINKLPGTLAQKGANTQERPHRFCRIESSPSQNVTQLETITRFLEKYPEPDDPAERAKKTAFAGFPDAFDLDSFMSEHGMTSSRIREDGGVKMFYLDECPFDSSHTNGDAKLFLNPNGSIGFKCHHDSCSGYKWKDVRLHFDPGAYDKKADLTGQKNIDRFTEKKGPTPKLEIVSGRDLSHMDLKPTEYIVDGFLPVGLAIVAAKPKIGKSWLALDLALSVSRGTQFLGFDTNKAGVVYFALEDSWNRLRDRSEKLVDNELPGNLYLAIKCQRIDLGLIDQLNSLLADHPGIKLIIFDTLQKIRPPAKKNESDYESVYNAIGKTMHDYAVNHRICILFIHHTRKESAHGQSSDPFDDLMGSQAIAGSCDTQIVLRKKNRSDEDATLYITGRDVEQQEYSVIFSEYHWRIMGDAAQVEMQKLEAEYLSSPGVKYIKKTLDEVPGHQIKITAAELMRSVREAYGYVDGKSSERVESFSRAISRFDLLFARDGIIHEKPSSTSTIGGASKRYHTFKMKR